MSRLTHEEIVDQVADAVVRASTSYTPDQLRAYKACLAKEPNPHACWVLEGLIENALKAQEVKLPLCDDTGIPHVVIELGSEAQMPAGFLPAVEQGIEQVQALNQAISSAKEAVQGEKKAVMAGTRTFVDALDAERRLFESMREQALSVYSLANNRLKFLALAGVVDAEAVEVVSVWLNSAKM